MNAEQILESNDFIKCAEFHGHICPGLAIGFRAAKVGLEKLAETRSEDEELVTIVETDACGSDAVQVLSGCTFGKGNFIHKDYGKHAFSFLSRQSGKGIRVALKAGAFQPQGRHLELIKKIRSNEATQAEQAEFKQIHAQKSKDILNMNSEDLFIIEQIEMRLPEKAKMEPSETCSLCGEPTMKSKLNEVSGTLHCRSCSGQ